MGAEIEVTLDERAGAMANRLARAVREADLDEKAAAIVVAAFRDAHADRDDIGDPHAPAALHPARNALILLEDADVRDPAELCAAVLYDSTRAAPDPVADPAVAALLDELPWNGALEDDVLVEMLVVASDAARRVALADRLDHARHLHLAPKESWEPFHRVTSEVWLPIAERTHPVLARRFRWWTRMFGRRWLPRART